MRDPSVRTGPRPLPPYRIEPGAGWRGGLCGLRGLVGRLRSGPPPLVPEFDRAAFHAFMCAEVFCYSSAYARQNVRIHGAERLLESTAGGGAVLAFLHYGSFFLSGGAIRHGLGLPYTALSTSRNLRPELLGAGRYAFWRHVRLAAGAMYGSRLIFSGESPRLALNWLREGGVLGIALDVREAGHRPIEVPVPCEGRTWFLQEGPVRIARLTGVPMLPMSIRYDARMRVHDLFIGEAVLPEDDSAATLARLLAPLLADARQDPRQWFHDIDSFTRPCAAVG